MTVKALHIGLWSSPETFGLHLGLMYHPGLVTTLYCLDEYFLWYGSLISLDVDLLVNLLHNLGCGTN